jgi:hypothetical protein
MFPGETEMDQAHCRIDCPRVVEERAQRRRDSRVSHISQTMKVAQSIARGFFTPTLFLDFDGVLHPAPVWRPPGRPPDLDRDAEPGRRLFDRAEALAAALNDVDVAIVLATSGVPVKRYSHALRRLPAALAVKVVGATYHSAISRYEWHPHLKNAA